MNRVVFVPKQQYAAYWRKAEAFYRAMKDAEKEGNWISLCLEAIHCAISSADALTAYHCGQRSKGQSHLDVIAILKQMKLPQVQEKIDQLRSVIEQKNDVEYEDFFPTEKEARKMALQAERFFLWAKQQLPLPA